MFASGEIAYLRKPQDAHVQIECRIRNLHNVAAGGATDS